MNRDGDPTYRDATNAMRDTTRWLVAFVPTSTIVAAGAVVAPRVIDSGGSAGDLAGWTLVAALALIVIVATAARVLTVQPASFRALITDANANRSDPSPAGQALLDRAVADGVLYFHYPDLDAMKSAVFRAWSQDGGDPAALAAAAELRAYALYRSTKQRFVEFLTLGAVGLVALVGAAFGALMVFDEDTLRIDEPSAVTLVLSDSGAAALREATGCDPAAVNEVVAVGGDWSDPVLIVNGSGCRPGRPWTPTPADLDAPVVPAG